jgi:hypothetical protein
VEKYGTARQATDDDIIRRMRFACRITKATDTHSEYVILIAFRLATVVTRTRLSVTLYVHCLSCCETKTVIKLYKFCTYNVCDPHSSMQNMNT